MALIYDVSFDSQTRILSLLDKSGNSISSCEVPSKSKSKELTLTATEDNSSVALKKVGDVNNTYEYKLNNGDWTSYTLTTSGVVIPLSAGDKIQWRCTNRPTTFSVMVYVQFVMTGKIEASNPVTSMVLYTLDPSSLYGYDFACCRLFSDCSALIKAPELPATILATGCYGGMFYACNSLTRAPALPATTLVEHCYSAKLAAIFTTFFGMFSNCSNLKEIRCAATNPSANSLYEWLQNVSTTGDFWCDPNVTWKTGISGSPSGWTRHDIADYPNQ